MINKNLPIGTVVLLRGGLKKVMITGYSSVSEDNKEKVYDYNGCIFPEGLMENVYALFDASQIEEVFYKGLENDEHEEYMNKRASMLGTNVRNGLVDLDGRNKEQPQKGRRRRTAPTNPRSKSEMYARYGVKQISGDCEEFE